jgi:hypothetical protein
MIGNILFLVDFSPPCVAMAAYVKRAATIFGSRVTVLMIRRSPFPVLSL